MIELVIAACLAQGAPGGGCDTFRMQYDPYAVSLMTCMVAGQAEVARWQETHADWRVTRWSCRVFDPSRAET